MTKQTREADRIQCLECGRWFRALPTHLRRSHDMTDEDYRLKYRIPVGLPLVCEEWSNNQRKRNLARSSKDTLSARGPSKGFSQRESVASRRKEHYQQLARQGAIAAAKKDKTAERIKQLAPYPVNVTTAMDRLGCTRSAAYTFLCYCVRRGKLRRIARGLYSPCDPSPKANP